MILVASFLTSHFGEWRQSWHGMPRRARVGTDSATEVDEANEGVLAAIDFDSGKVIRTVVLDTPSGFAVKDGTLYVASMYGNRILALNRSFEIVDTFATRLMNDLHGVSLCQDGLLVSSSGADAVLEISFTGTPKWEWLATEHGFGRNLTGHHVRTKRNHDYRLNVIATGAQATHCNSALPHRLAGRDVVLVTLFHQGRLISVDRATGRPALLVRGMRNPHAVRRLADGWVMSDSRSSTVVMLDEDFWVSSIIEADFNWVQDAVPLGEGAEILIADANNSRIVLWDTMRGKMLHSIAYPPEWKIYQIEVADPAWEEALRITATTRETPSC